MMQNKTINYWFILFVFLCTLLLPLLYPVALSAQSVDQLLPQVIHAHDTELHQIIAESDLIAIGRVLASNSSWSADKSIIESLTIVALTRRLKGDAPRQIKVNTVGGFIDDENLGMARMHEPSFTVGEDVLIFARNHADGYRVVGGAAGKYQITGANVLNYFHAKRGSLQQLLNYIETALSYKRQNYTLPRNLPVHSSWQENWLSNVAQQYFLTSGHRKWTATDGFVPFYVNVNTDQANLAGGRGTFLQSIRNAAETWNLVPDADFTLRYVGGTSATNVSYNGHNEVLFMKKGREERGAVAHVWYRRDLTLVEADIWINDSYDWSAGGPLAPDELDLESVLLHEFGHWLVLGHLDDAEAVMYHKLSGGMVKRLLHPVDEQGIATIYPCHTKSCFGNVE